METKMATTQTWRTTLFDGQRQNLVYIEFEKAAFYRTPKLVSVKLAGDLLDITDKLTETERRRIQKRLEAKF
jgi:hypothetical protein